MTDKFKVGDLVRRNVQSSTSGLMSSMSPSRRSFWRMQGVGIVINVHDGGIVAPGGFIRVLYADGDNDCWTENDLEKVQDG